jgi:hypothetical protein
MKRFAILGVLLNVAMTAKADMAGVLQKAGIRGRIACVVGADQAETAVGV